MDQAVIKAFNLGCAAFRTGKSCRMETDPALLKLMETTRTVKAVILITAWRRGWSAASEGSE